LHLGPVCFVLWIFYLLKVLGRICCRRHRLLVLFGVQGRDIRQRWSILMLQLYCGHLLELFGRRMRRLRCRILRRCYRLRSVRGVRSGVVCVHRRHHLFQVRGGHGPDSR